MKKYWVLLLLLAIAMFITNPGKAEFNTWAKDQTVSRSDNMLSKGLSSLFGSTIADLTTKRQNYYLFSVYSVDIPSFTSNQSHHSYVLGIFKNFITLSN